MVGVVAAALVAAGTMTAAEPTTATGDSPGVLVEPEQDARVSPAVTPIASTFVPVASQRVLDTRVSGTPLGPGRSITVNLSGQTPDTATSVVLNVTGVSPTLSTFVTVYPAGEGRPVTSNLNLAAGKTRANAVVVALSPDRRVTLYNNSGNVHLVVDLAGFYDEGAEHALYNPQAPVRALDTRYTQPVGPGGRVNVNLSYLPASATAVTFNLTAVGATASTFVTAYPTGQSRPAASNLNVLPGEIVPNQVTVALGTGRSVTLYNNSGSVHLIVDVVGYYSAETGYQFVAVTPERVLDTRPGNGLRPEYFLALDGWGEETDPMAIMAVAANLTGLNSTASTYITAWPGGEPKPLASSLNLVPGQIAANAVTVGIGYEPTQGIQERTVNFGNNAGYVDLVFDVDGLFVQFNE